MLKGVDGIVFVADSQWTMLPKNLESWQNLKDNLKTNEITFESIPVVVQYNKRDLADILAVDAMQEALGLSSYPFVEAVAQRGPRRHRDVQAHLEADVRGPAAASAGPARRGRGAARSRRRPPRRPARTTCRPGRIRS